MHVGFGTVLMVTHTSPKSLRNSPGRPSNRTNGVTVRTRSVCASAYRALVPPVSPRIAGRPADARAPRRYRRFVQTLNR